MSQYQLTIELIKLSESKNWEEAKLEWDIASIEKVENAETCLCGHFPILEICLIYNIKTNQYSRVGNCCVKKFNNKSDKIFRAVAKIRKDDKKSVNSETLSFALKNKWIDIKSFNFYIDILKKRNLSDKQLKWKISVNKKIIYMVGIN